MVDFGYRVFYQVLNSKNFGVPQNRERIYIVAFRDDIHLKILFFQKKKKKTDDTKVIKDIVEEDEVSMKYYLSTAYLTSLKKT